MMRYSTYSITIIASYVIWDEVKYYLHAVSVGPVHQITKFIHSVALAFGKIRVDIVVVGYRVWGTGITLYEILSAGMSDCASKPKV